MEEPFGWAKTIGGARKLRYKGRERNKAWWLRSAEKPERAAAQPEARPTGEVGDVLGDTDG